ncbi:hypothetical protein HYALB_00006727 [Hymenoscyphus albidus]|uniref:Uncharacterized protein n=1 Tax=Hymenoscyphus albidus TaxID=595503 RepID=A0A9N9Q2G2_9HELO|nr:hypothetical protein HYALB_00006727 [Hymenoscyphus albidus]
MIGSWPLGRSEYLRGGETQGLTEGRHKAHEVETQTKISTTAQHSTLISHKETLNFYSDNSTT